MPYFSRTHRYLLSLLSGILMVVSFPHIGSLFPLIFIAWIPLLLIEHQVYMRKYKPSTLFLHSYLSFLIFNVGTTYWIYYAKGGEAGAVMAFLLNAFLMTLFFMCFHYTKRFIGQKEGYIGFVFYWLAFEYFHYNWELSWPWINQGNVFAIVPQIIQWYSYTGVLGGTLWILLTNLVLFKLALNLFVKKERFKIQTPIVYTSLALILTPAILSFTTYYNYKEKENPFEVVLLQPNIDPYKDKFSTDQIVQNSHIKHLINLADSLITPQTELVIGPETALAYSFNETEFEFTSAYQLLHKKVKNWNGPALYLGASTYRFLDKYNSRASRPLRNGSGFIEYYNTSLILEKLNPPRYIHKSKLVLGVEKVPFSHIFPILEELSIQNGGASGTLGIEDYPKNFTANGITFAPVICYESVYGDFIAEQCRNNAEAIFIITNDGWWENSAGHKQHQSFARLRAIENRKYVARSANTGISSIINQRGDVVKKTPYWKSTAIRGTIHLNETHTFYTTYGNIIGRTSGFVFFLLISFTFVKFIKRKK